MVKKIDLIYVDISPTKNKGDTPNCLLLKFFGDAYRLHFKSLAVRNQFEKLLYTLCEEEVQDAVLRMDIDISAPPPAIPTPRQPNSESDKIKSLLSENSHLSQQLAKISRSANPLLSKPHSKGKIIFVFYGPPCTGKTSLARHIIQHCRSVLKILCAYIPEASLRVSSVNPTPGIPSTSYSPLSQMDLLFARALIETVLSTEDPHYDLVLIDGTFEGTVSSFLQTLTELSKQIIPVCCYAPFTLRQERNRTQSSIQPCHSFELTALGSIFVDTSKPLSDVYDTQILPIISALGFEASHSTKQPT